MENKHKEYATFLLAQMFGWGYSDVEHLLEAFQALDNMGISYGDISEEIEATEGKISEINTWIYFTYDRINNDIFAKVMEKLSDALEEGENESIHELAQEKINNFSPFINCLDSHFNNLLDNHYFCEMSCEDEFLDKIIEELKKEINDV